eukprot:XP_024998404.1 transmembrane protein 52 isoform X2 [Gallus gallus]
MLNTVTFFWLQTHCQRSIKTFSSVFLYVLTRLSKNTNYLLSQSFVTVFYSYFLIYFSLCLQNTSETSQPPAVCSAARKSHRYPFVKSNEQQSNTAPVKPLPAAFSPSGLLFYHVSNFTASIVRGRPTQSPAAAARSRAGTSGTPERVRGARRGPCGGAPQEITALRGPGGLGPASAPPRGGRLRSARRAAAPLCSSVDSTKDSDHSFPAPGRDLAALAARTEPHNALLRKDSEVSAAGSQLAGSSPGPKAPLCIKSIPNLHLEYCCV